jgi:hypothetical protein
MEVFAVAFGFLAITFTATLQWWFKEELKAEVTKYENSLKKVSQM